MTITDKLHLMEQMKRNNEKHVEEWKKKREGGND